MIVVPTKRKPRFFRSLLMASEIFVLTIILLVGSRFDCNGLPSTNLQM